MIRFLTSGESHGPELSVIVEGVPAGLSISEEYIACDLARRQQGYGRGGRMQIERDYAVIRSGVRHGLTLGSPIALQMENKDFENGVGPDGLPWTHTMSSTPVKGKVNPIHRLRPGHADTPGIAKYFQSDARNILERSSARESTARVAAGAIARRFLEEFGVEIHSHVVALGGIHTSPSDPIDWKAVEGSSVRCANEDVGKAMMAAIDSAREAGDSVGGTVEIIANGLPIGLGSHIQWDRKLTTRLAGAVMSMNAIKGVEFGAGFTQSDMLGSQVHDVIKPIEKWEYNADGTWVKPWPRATNNSGGLEGGMTTGEPLVIRATVKPIATLKTPLPTVDLISGQLAEAHYERSDITFVPTCGVIGEAMASLVLADAFLEKFGGDHLEETRRNLVAYMATLGPRGH